MITDPRRLCVADLRVGLQRPGHEPVPIVDGVSFDLHRGEIVGVVGESGCGKSLTASAVLRLFESASMQVLSGSIRLDDTELTDLSERQLRRVRGRHVGMVFQDPATYLDPLLPVGAQVAEPLRAHGWEGDRHRRVVDLLGRVALPEPERVARMYPHELSGGMQQRVLIAAALALDPAFLVADEPTTALDVTVQAEILELLSDLGHADGLGVLLITHDLGVVSSSCERVYVMYAGRVVEHNLTRDLFASPAHPYTEGLVRSVPIMAATADELFSIPGRVPPLTSAFHGCRFADRCPVAADACTTTDPALVRVGEHHGHACLETDAFPRGRAWEAPDGTDVTTRSATS